MAKNCAVFLLINILIVSADCKADLGKSVSQAKELFGKTVEKIQKNCEFTNIEEEPYEVFKVSEIGSKVAQGFKSAVKWVQENGEFVDAEDKKREEALAAQEANVTSYQVPEIGNKVAQEFKSAVKWVQNLSFSRLKNYIRCGNYMPNKTKNSVTPDVRKEDVVADVASSDAVSLTNVTQSADLAPSTDVVLSADAAPSVINSVESSTNVRLSVDVAPSADVAQSIDIVPSTSEMPSMDVVSTNGVAQLPEVVLPVDVASSAINSVESSTAVESAAHVRLSADVAHDVELSTKAIPSIIDSDSVDSLTRNVVESSTNVTSSVVSIQSSNYKTYVALTATVAICGYIYYKGYFGACVRYVKNNLFKSKK